MLKWLLIFIFCVTPIFAHEGHEAARTIVTEQNHSKLQQNAGKSLNWFEWFGEWHFIFLHFPIALIIMTLVAELLYLKNNSLIYNYAAQFMLISGATLSIPTVIFGLIFSYTGVYEGIFESLLFWHMWTGIGVSILSIWIAYIRFDFGLSKTYYFLLLTLLILVNVSSFLGGAMTFGPYQVIPPIQ